MSPAGLAEAAARLAGSLAAWQCRDRVGPYAGARRAASDAVDAIDAMLAGLHAVRARLIGEIRASDDEAAARVDALLAARRG